MGIAAGVESMSLDNWAPTNQALTATHNDLIGDNTSALACMIPVGFLFFLSCCWGDFFARALSLSLSLSFFCVIRTKFFSGVAT